MAEPRSVIGSTPWSTTLSARSLRGQYRFCGQQHTMMSCCSIILPGSFRSIFESCTSFSRAIFSTLHLQMPKGTLLIAFEHV